MVYKAPQVVVLILRFDFLLLEKKIDNNLLGNTAILFIDILSMKPILQIY